VVVVAISALAIRSGGADHRPSLPLYDYVVVGGGLRSQLQQPTVAGLPVAATAAIEKRVGEDCVVK